MRGNKSPERYRYMPRAELARGRLRTRLDAEREAHGLFPVDPEDEYVRALGLEHQAVEVQRQGRGPFTVG